MYTYTHTGPLWSVHKENTLCALIIQNNGICGTYDVVFQAELTDDEREQLKNEAMEEIPGSKVFIERELT